MLVRANVKKRKYAVHLRGKPHGKEIDEDDLARGGGIISVDSKEGFKDQKFGFNTVDDIKEMLSDMAEFSPGVRPE